MLIGGCIGDWHSVNFLTWPSTEALIGHHGVAAGEMGGTVALCTRIHVGSHTNQHGLYAHRPIPTRFARALPRPLEAL